ncbi:DUF397 domain-containing protein [Streptomyces sp. NPDC058755]|uniref:DUF397 domain-containing protein n=1 Tax=Streptomyces sp. NPDC058755 TaxID=3346624 RepID=UPI0036A77B69
MGRARRPSGRPAPPRGGGRGPTRRRGGGSSDSCVEVATTPATIHIRDSKTPETGQLKVTPSAWAVFLTHAAK